MRIKIIYALFILIILSGKTNAQTWNNVGGTLGFNGLVRCLLTDTINNFLYAGGNFTSVDGVTALNVAKWDGSNWSALGSNGS
nr:hypothetical protein [Bacteroidia bacterium]